MSLAGASRWTSPRKNLEEMERPPRLPVFPAGQDLWKVSRLAPADLLSSLLTNPSESEAFAAQTDSRGETAAGQGSFEMKPRYFPIARSTARFVQDSNSYSFSLR